MMTNPGSLSWTAALMVLLWVPMRADAQSSDVQSSQLPEGYREVVAADRRASMRELCEATAESGLYSGAVLVAQRGEVIYEGAFGFANREWSIPNTLDTKFRLASVSKQFCSLLVLQLAQEGKLELDDHITDHLAYYRKDTGNQVTIHHLLAHQSGVPDFTASPEYRRTISRTSYGKDEFIQKHCSGDLLHKPGTIYSYSNAGYCILGRIIEKTTGKSFEQSLQERIFTPLGMGDSGLDQNSKIVERRASGYTLGSFGLENADYLEMSSTPGPAGGIYSTVRDMLLWDRALKTDQLLSEQYRQKMFTPNRDVPEVKAAGGRPHSNYGYGWQIFARNHPITKFRMNVIYHGGAINGFRAAESRLVDQDAFVIVLCNQGDSYGGSEVWNAVTALNRELSHIVANQPYKMPARRKRTQDQVMYDLAVEKGSEATIAWFREKGKPAAWGGSMLKVSERLIQEGRAEVALELMEFDLQQTPGKVWLLRKTAQAVLEHGNPQRALELATQGLELRPEDEAFQQIQAEAKGDLE